VGLGLGSGEIPEVLLGALADDSSSVRVAAAQSVALLGDPERAKGVLLESLKDEDPWIRLMAVIAIDELDVIAQTVRDDLRPYREDESKYVARVANRILNRIEGTSERVR
jgi:HEAT repeat protein